MGYYGHVVVSINRVIKGSVLDLDYRCWLQKGLFWDIFSHLDMVLVSYVLNWCSIMKVNLFIPILIVEKNRLIKRYRQTTNMGT